MRPTGRVERGAAVAVALSVWALSPAFATASFLPYALLAVLAVAGSAALARRAAVPGVLVPLVSLAALVVTLTAILVPTGALLGLLPTPATVAAVRELVGQAAADIREQAAPVVAGAGLLLLTSAGVGRGHAARRRLAATAAASGPRRAAAAGARRGAGHGGRRRARPGAVPARGRRLPAAAARRRPGAGATRWGRVPGRVPPASRGPVVSPGVTTGRRLGVAALGLAVAVPALVPGPGERVPARRGGDGDGGATPSCRRTTRSSRLRGQLLQPEPVEILRVRTDDPGPGYLRLTALDQFDGSTWSPRT